MTIRLQKFIAHAGLCSRRKAEEYILNGYIKVNNKIVQTLGTKVDPESDTVYFKDKQIKLDPDGSYTYIMLNKPTGYITSCSHRNSKIVLDLIDINKRIYPVGRLDKESSGLILLTNDGNLHNRLSHPSFNHEKEYIVSTEFPLKNKDFEQMANGMIIDGKKTRKAVVKKISQKKFKITLKQGLNRQIRKMVGKLGNKVTSLKRIRITGIHLSDLKEGCWRYLSKEEIKKLNK